MLEYIQALIWNRIKLRYCVKEQKILRIVAESFFGWGSDGSFPILIASIFRIELLFLHNPNSFVP